MKNEKDNANAKLLHGKRKKYKKIMCYVSIVVLNILLFLPILCRKFVKEKEPEKKPDVVMILNCNKAEESVNSTFLNDEPQSILYKIKGDQTVVTNPDESNQNIDSMPGENISDNSNNETSNNVAVSVDNSQSNNVENNNTESSVSSNIESSINSNENSQSESSNNIESNNINETPTSTDNPTPSTDDISLYDLLRPISSVSYETEEDYTSLRTTIDNLRAFDNYTTSFNTVENQTKFFESYGFTCTKSVL